MPKLNLQCDMCNYKTTKYVGGWRKHLMEEEHQIQARERLSKMVKDADNKRCCVVFGVGDLSHEKLLKFFSEEDVVTDFVFWKERPDICVVEFYLKNACVTVTAGTNSIFGSEVVIKLRNEFTDIEWRTICPLFSHMKAEADADAMGNQVTNSPESDDDDCVVIENPQVQVKKEMIVLDVDLKPKCVTSIPAPSSDFSHSPTVTDNSTVSKRNSDVTQDIKPFANLMRPCDKQTSVIPKTTEYASPVIESQSSFAATISVKKEPNDEDKSTKKPLKTLSQPSNHCSDSVHPPPQKKPRIESDTSQRTIKAPAVEPELHNNRGNLVNEAESDLTNNGSKTLSSTQKTNKPKKLSTNYSFAVSPSPQFLHEAGRKRSPIQRILDSNSSKHIFWIQRVQEFNFLVWENLFGIELYKNTSEDATRATGVQVRNGFVQDGPLIRGILTTTDKIQEWTQLPTGKDTLKRTQLAFLESLKHGLGPKPLKDFDETARSLSKRSNTLLTFELQILRSVKAAKPACMLSFKNIVSSYLVDKKQFKLITQMYTGLWDDFCMWNLTKPNYR